MRSLSFSIGLFLAGCGPLPVLEQTFSVTPASLDVPHDPAGVAAGEVLVEQLLCAECHGEDLAGKVIIKGFPMGTVVGPNLTPAGPTQGYSDEDWIRVIRHGVRPDGSPVFMMPSSEYAAITQGDLAAAVAYLSQLSPIARDPGESRLGPVSRGLVKDGSWEVGATIIDHDAPIPQSAGDRGAYLAMVSGCYGCHAGGVGKGFGPGQPRSSNLTPHADGLAGWTLAQFSAAVRQGRRPDGTTLDPMMPYARYAELSDEDVAALWAWAQSLEPQPTP